MGNSPVLGNSVSTLVTVVKQPGCIKVEWPLAGLALDPKLLTSNAMALP